MENKNIGHALTDNQTKGHSKLDLEFRRIWLRNNEILNQVQDDRKRGFTLIELLVVVLIIGILAAVALPQYQLAIDKARFSRLIVMTDVVKKAQDIYYETAGDYTTNWDELDVNISGTITGAQLSSPNGWTMTLSHTTPNTGAANAVYAQDTLLPDIMLYNMYRFPTSRNANKINCYANPNSSRAVRLCKSVSGKQTKDSTGGSYDVYYIN